MQATVTLTGRQLEDKLEEWVSLKDAWREKELKKFWGARQKQRDKQGFFDRIFLPDPMYPEPFCYDLFRIEVESDIERDIRKLYPIVRRNPNMEFTIDAAIWGAIG